MSPRLEAVARYHRHYRRLIRASTYYPSGAAADELLRYATIAYRAMVVEAHPEKARDKA